MFAHDCSTPSEQNGLLKNGSITKSEHRAEETKYLSKVQLKSVYDQCAHYNFS